MSAVLAALDCAHSYSTEYEGVEFDVQYRYAPETPDSRWEQGDPEDFEVLSILHEGKDVSIVLAPQVVKDIEAETLQRARRTGE